MRLALLSRILEITAANSYKLLPISQYGKAGVSLYRAGGKPPSFSQLISGGNRRHAFGGKCGGGKTPPQVSCRKDQAGRLGTEEKAA